MQTHIHTYMHKYLSMHTLVKGDNLFELACNPVATRVFAFVKVHT